MEVFSTRRLEFGRNVTNIENVCGADSKSDDTISGIDMEFDCLYIKRSITDASKRGKKESVNMILGRY